MALEIKGIFETVTVDEVKPVIHLPKDVKMLKMTHKHCVWENGKGIFFREAGGGKTLYRAHWTAELYTQLKDLI